MAGTASTNYLKVLVHLRKTSQTAYKLAKFNKCILDHLGLSGDGFVECTLENNQLLLQCPDSENSNNTDSSGPNEKSVQYRIMHPPFCPIQHLDEEGSAALPHEIITRGVDVGVAVLLESSDKHLLLTRRAAHMRTFAGLWVPPGGHVEKGETLEDAVLRELEEETGLLVTLEERQNAHILGLWESVYPPLLELGQPKRHHVVIYLHITLQRTSEELQKQFKLCPEEVDAAVWMSVDLIKLAVWNTKFAEQYQSQSTGNVSQDEVYITLVNKEGEHAASTIAASILKESDESSDLNFERITTGSRFALSMWLEQHLKDSGLPETSQKELYSKYISHVVTEDKSTDSLPKLRPKM
ncbi:nucleoside diphosphate-linked moiety X motif 17 isoform X1 [Procambarus clarkii]|uniref:nucleoside diphosphate-linked moiety X motif 17 isoform X1 n=1 Tax=Procambarus clarkii TaxID=6728 RepID=UPI001E674FE5|nr:nucleoside diphosphate-linked moiety X motif 17-like isoform X1 [Procambarus clarkii]